MSQALRDCVRGFCAFVCRALSSAQPQVHPDNVNQGTDFAEVLSPRAFPAFLDRRHGEQRRLTERKIV